MDVFIIWKCESWLPAQEVRFCLDGSIVSLQPYRRLPFYGFLATIPPLMWFYYRHSALRIPGGTSALLSYLETKLTRGELAYTYYSMFEWSLVFWDLAFDALSVLELNHLQVGILKSPFKVSSTQSSTPFRLLSLTLLLLRLKSESLKMQGGFVDISKQGTWSKQHISSRSSACRQSAFYLAKPSIPEHLEDQIHIDWTSQGVGKPSPAWRQAVAWLSDVYFGKWLAMLI